MLYASGKLAGASGFEPELSGLEPLVLTVTPRPEKILSQLFWNVAASTCAGRRPEPLDIFASLKLADGLAGPVTCASIIR